MIIILCCLLHLGKKCVDRHVALALGADVSGDRKGGRLASEEAGVGVHVANVELDGALIRGGEETVGPRAVAFNKNKKRQVRQCKK